MEDPAEIVQARNVAITHVCFELLAALFCPTRTLCVFTTFFAVLLSTVVAYCSKQSMTYILWSWLGVLLLASHAISAAKAFEVEDCFFLVVSDFPVFVFLLQMFLCGVNAQIIFLGCAISTVSRQRGLNDPVDMPLEIPTLASMHPAAEVQDLKLRHV